MSPLERDLQRLAVSAVRSYLNEHPPPQPLLAGSLAKRVAAVVHQYLAANAVTPESASAKRVSGLESEVRRLRRRNRRLADAHTLLAERLGLKKGGTTVEAAHPHAVHGR